MRFADKRGGEADSKVASLSSFKSLSSKQAGTRNVWPLILLLALVSITIYGVFIFAATVDVESPPNASISTNGSVNLFCEVKIDADDNFGPNNLTNVSLWINSTGAWIRNATVSDMSNATNIFNGTGGGVKVQFNLTGLGTKRGDFYWFCSVAANASHAGYNESRNESYKTFKVDRTGPSVRVRNPLNGGYLNSTTTGFWEVELLEHNPNATNVSFYYRRGAQGSWIAFKPMTCKQSPAGQYEDSNNCTVNADMVADFGGVIEGDIIYFYFNASDIANNTASNGTASSPMSVTVDTIKPVLNVFNITGAGVNWNTRTSTIGLFNVTFNVSDAAPQNCTLLHNISSAGYVSNYTVGYTSNASSNFTIPNVNGIAFITNGSGIYNFTITCNDSAANTITTNRNLTIAVDTQAPNVTINSPANNISLRTRTLFVNFTPSDDMNNTRPSAAVNDSLVSAGNDSCELWTNMTGAWVINTTVTNKSGFANGAGIHNFTLTFSSDGKYLFAAQCNDTAGNKNS
ncbi:hypothetical protein HYV82_05465, partial [Candidatus Woesearchaeota archaeon]|nr:hypothetical protein [Candidatus Woesearchaeota archaeon]